MTTPSEQACSLPNAEYRPDTGQDPHVHFSDGVVVRFERGNRYPVWVNPPDPPLQGNQHIPVDNWYAVEAHHLLVRAGVLPAPEAEDVQAPSVA